MKIRDEIGSEFWDIPTQKINNGIFDDEVEWFLSGRVALMRIIEEIKKEKFVKSVSLPSWCCESMIRPFVDAGFEICFYPIIDGIQDLSNVNTDVLLVLDYFGYTGQSNFENYKGIVIRDVTHSFFSNKYDDANYYFGSLRKWAGFKTGGFAIGVKNSGDKVVYKEFVRNRSNAMLKKTEYMLGKINQKEYLNDYNEAETLLDEVKEIYAASTDDVTKAYILNIQEMKYRRRENAQRLLQEFSDIALFKNLKEDDCPMFVPILIPNGKRDELRKYLIEQDIYCPVHWPISDYHILNKETEYVYRSELSLICDQRYTLVDMERLIKTVNQFWKEKM